MYVDKETSEVRYLQAFDFVLFALFMAVSAGIGVFYAIRAKRQGTSNRDYLLGNQELHVLPVAIAMVLSLASATSMLGMPAEVYMGGIEYIYVIAGVAVALLIAGWQFVPLFYDLKLTSSLEYLELRFKSKAAKLTATILIIIQSLFYLAVVMYSPSVALEAVTGFPVWLSILCVLVVSTIYTALGGLRAVVLTDAVQMVVIVSGFLALIIQGTVEVGGMDKVFDISRAGGRLEQIHFDFDLRVRHSFWSLVLGSAPQILVFSAVNPASVQRYKAVPTLTKARLVVFGSLLIWVVYISLVSLTGLVIFAYYSSKQCDPLRANYLKNINQIVPYYLMDTLYYPGVPGIYLASLFSGTLSSTSAVQVALAAVTWEDLLKAKYGHISERRKVVVCQCLVIFYGIISAGLAFMIGVVKGTTVIQVKSNKK
ncbi:sodium-coupled monocarboxylate transporter 2-like [Lingula anatina]|uniref:Sodium-coupled monocarboxylate transporter 2-like n=1 Tax=Lingula anatina TaxID=7574 RepID=A0A1S3HM14_LINAN|nr:sodium-coupled monocarboxylate transporter 2-like [Lingula anatina]|eukprot:XP_013387135.1 sodium-coupled monocarboxylate transporter 2-like [Lingula anatina]